MLTRNIFSCFVILVVAIINGFCSHLAENVIISITISLLSIIVATYLIVRYKEAEHRVNTYLCYIKMLALTKRMIVIITGIVVGKLLTYIFPQEPEKRQDALEEAMRIMDEQMKLFEDFF